MTEKELNRARELKELIRSKERQLLCLRRSAENIVPILDGLPHSTDVKSRVENYADDCCQRTRAGESSQAIYSVEVRAC